MSTRRETRGMNAPQYETSRQSSRRGARSMVLVSTAFAVTAWAAACGGGNTASTDRVALEALYHTADGPNWSRSANWLSDVPLGDWHGVDTDEDGRVVELDLRRNRLAGPVPPELGNLSNLMRLGLSGNQLTGSIPPELGRLSALQELGLSGNALVGRIPPELGELSSLRQLSLSGNQLTGLIPEQLGQLQALEELSLGSNQLTGSIPESLLQLNWLRSFGFSNNADLCASPTASWVVRREVLTTVVGPYCAAPESRPVEEPDLSLWEGSWLDVSSSIGDNYYAMLSIAEVGVNGFTYSFECRDVPYGPNAQSSGQARATFRGPFSAEDQASGERFSLLIDTDDRHARVIRAGPHSYIIGEGCNSGTGDFVFRRTTYKAGFDCDQAATPVEAAICGNELIAFGDWELTEAYRALRASAAAEDGAALLASQRAWLGRRNSVCLGGDEAVDEICLARLYSDRLVELARIGDPGFGTGPRFDAAYVTALLNRGASPFRDLAVRLAMYPLVIGTATWQADDGGVLFESTHVDVHVVWPSDVEFRYSQMLFIGSDGTVWTANHIEPLVELQHLKELGPSQVWIAAGGDPFTIRSETGVESTAPPTPADGVPDLVQSWLDRHPIAETMRHLPPDAITQTVQPSCREWNTEEFFRRATGADVVRCLDQGLEVNARTLPSWPESRTPLHLAAEFGNPSSIAALIDAGAEIEARADHGESGGPFSDGTNKTALWVAVVWGTTANAKALTEADANIDNDIVYWAAGRGSPGDLQVLIDAGADIETSLFAAVYGGPANIGVLLASGADYRSRDAFGNTPLHAAADTEFWEDAARAAGSIRALLEAGADIEARNAEGSTPLHVAAGCCGGPASVRALVEAGADIEARNAAGRTPLHVAASMRYDGLESGDIGSLRALIEAGANVEARDNEGRTPLHVAALQPGSETKIGVLLEAGADIEARNGGGRTPLHLAAGIEYSEWASNNLAVLLKAGASVESEDENGQKPVDVARAMGLAANVAMLIGDR